MAERLSPPLSTNPNLLVAHSSEGTGRHFFFGYGGSRGPLFLPGNLGEVTEAIFRLTSAGAEARRDSAAIFVTGDAHACELDGLCLCGRFVCTKFGRLEIAPCLVFPFSDERLFDQRIGILPVPLNGHISRSPFFFIFLFTLIFFFFKF